VCVPVCVVCACSVMCAASNFDLNLFVVRRQQLCVRACVVCACSVMCAASNCDLELIDVGLDVEGGLEAVLESEEPDTVATQHVTVTHDHKVRVAI